MKIISSIGITDRDEDGSTIVKAKPAVSIKVRYLKEDNEDYTVSIVPKLQSAHPGEWIDMYNFKEVTLKKGESTIISLGVIIALPFGYEAILASRSSTFKKWGLIQTNGVGVIDNAYCGPNDVWGYPVYATRDVTIPANTKLCQFRIQETQPSIRFEPYGEINEATDRGGFGSTDNNDGDGGL